ncbi:MAG: DnaJ domain-containing protein [Micrococcus sp.]|nr:DnaJ domain-containing protein [Micrococcus sp.]
MNGQDAYAVLGASPDASDEDLRRAYRRAARRTHPDAGGTTEDFRAVSAAWDLVATPERRRRYDLSRPEVATPGRPGPASGAAFTAAPRARSTTPGRGSASGRRTTVPRPVTYRPALEQDPVPAGVIDAVRAQQRWHGVPRKRGVLPDDHRVQRQARVLHLLNDQVLDAFPAARVVTGVSLGSRWQRGLDVDHVVLCGDRLAVIGSVQVPDGVYTWDGMRLHAGRTGAAPPLLGPAMIALQQALPHVSVGGFVLVMTDSDALHAPIVRIAPAGRRPQNQDDLLTEPPAPGKTFARDLSLFLGTGSARDTVDRATLGALVSWMY